ncbi:MAG: hypothetical protein RIS35_1473 [Pseudomonadota bacterium]
MPNLARIADIKRRLNDAGPVQAYANGSLVMHPRAVDFYANAASDIRYLLAQVEATARCGCPRASVTMHARDCPDRPSPRDG